MTNGVPLAIVFAVVSVIYAVAPFNPLLKLVRLQVCPAAPAMGPSCVVTVAAPEQVAVPLESVAVVGAEVAPVPPAVMTSGVPLAMVLSPVKATVAAALVEPLLKLLTTQVCPAVPAIDLPEHKLPPRRMPVLPVAEMKFALARMSGVTAGIGQALLALVTEGGAHSNCCWLLLSQVAGLGIKLSNLAL